MQDLTGKFHAPLVPSLMEGGNLMADPAIKATEQTATGSLPASPLPTAYGGEHLGPDLSNADSGAHTVTPIKPSLEIDHPPRIGEHDRQGNTATGYHGWTHADGSGYPDGRHTWHEV